MALFIKIISQRDHQLSSKPLAMVHPKALQEIINKHSKTKSRIKTKATNRRIGQLMPLKCKQIKKIMKFLLLQNPNNLTCLRMSNKRRNFRKIMFLLQESNMEPLQKRWTYQKDRMKEKTNPVCIRIIRKAHVLKGANQLSLSLSRAVNVNYPWIGSHQF